MRIPFKYPLAYLYSAVVIWLGAGAAAYGARNAILLLLCHGVAFCIAFVGLAALNVFDVSWLIARTANVTKQIAYKKQGFWPAAAVVLGAFCVTIWISLGGVPFLEALTAKDSLDAVRIRTLISERSGWATNYAIAIALTGVMPIVCMFAFVLEAPLRRVILALCLVFACSLLQKSHPLILIFPSLIYFLLSRRYILSLKLLSVGLLGGALVHCVLVGYLSVGNFVNAAHAAEDVHPSSVKVSWFALRLNEADGTWEDGRLAFGKKSESSLDKLRFDGRQAFYSPLPSDLKLGSAEFEVTLDYLPRTRMKDLGYATLIYMGGAEGLEGGFELLHRSSQEKGDYLEFIVMDSASRKTLSVTSDPLKIGMPNTVTLSRVGQELGISVDGRSRAVKFDGGIDLTPKKDGEGVLQLGVQFAGGNRGSSGIMRHSEIGEIAFLRLPGRDKELRGRTSLIRPQFVITAKAIQSSLAEATSVPNLGRNGSKSQLYVNVTNLADRIFRIPGRTGAIWMDFVPDSLPFLRGCGYRLLAPLLGCTFQNYAEEIHALYEPDLHGAGIKGTMNVAEVFNSYANFGMWGGIISGIAMAMLLYGISRLFESHRKVGVAISAGPVLMSSSTALLTQLLSGGWGIAIVLSLLFCSWSSGPSEGDGAPLDTDAKLGK